METLSQTASRGVDPRADLAALEEDTPLRHADLYVAKGRLTEARVEYARARIDLTDLTALEAEHTAAVKALEQHMASIAAVQALIHEQEDRHERLALLAELDAINAELTELETANVRELEAAELRLHETRIRVRQRRDQARDRRGRGRQAHARLSALCGVPSPAVAPITDLADLNDYETRLSWWRLGDADVPDWMDVHHLHTDASPDEARADHAARWKSELARASTWPTIRPPFPEEGDEA